MPRPIHVGPCTANVLGVGVTCYVKEHTSSWCCERDNGRDTMCGLMAVAYM